MNRFTLLFLAIFALCVPASAEATPPELREFVQSWTPTWYPPGKGPETKEEREARWDAITDIAYDVGMNPPDVGEADMWGVDLVALTLTTFRFESALDYHVHGGEESPIGTQDHGRARCLGQLHRNGRSEEEWLALAGRTHDATERCTRATVSAFLYHAQRCKLRRKIPPARRWKAMLTPQEAHILFTAYWSGTQCNPARAPWLRSRVDFFERVRAKAL